MAYAASSAVFSLRAPTHPVKPKQSLKDFLRFPNFSPMTKVIAPAHMKMNAGSKAMFVNFDRLLNVSFSIQAQMPIARTPSPNNC